jgi:hypothetical protein
MTSAQGSVAECLEIDPEDLRAVGVDEVIDALAIGQVRIARSLADRLVRPDEPAVGRHALIGGFADGRWSAVDDPAVRRRRALGEHYPFYRTNAQILGNIIRELSMMTEVGGVEPC